MRSFSYISMVVQLAASMLACITRKPAKLTANALLMTTAIKATAELRGAAESVAAQEVQIDEGRVTDVSACMTRRLGEKRAVDDHGYKSHRRAAAGVLTVCYAVLWQCAEQLTEGMREER